MKGSELLAPRALSIGLLLVAACTNSKLRGQPDGAATGGVGGGAGTTAPTGSDGGTGGVAGTGDVAGATGAAGTNGVAGTGAAGAPVVGKPCTGLGCQQSTCTAGNCTVPACPQGRRTRISGKIFDPAGKRPLFNIAVFVPNMALDPINDGPSCDPCDPRTGTSPLSGSPLVMTKTDETGAFHLGADGASDVPAGTNIPMVLQVGKWRRQVTIPTVTACQDNVITDMELLHLPRNSTEGHIPKMAITTGEKDALQCLLLKVGVDPSEFTPEAGTGRINLFMGAGGSSAYDVTLNGGATFTTANPWWDSYDNLAKYDVILHSCEGGLGDYNSEQIATGMMDPITGRVRGEPASVKSMAARMALEKFANLGGRVFASHYHAYWFAEGTPSFKMIATWGRLAGVLSPMGVIDQTFPTGASLAQWLVNVGGSAVVGTVDLTQDAATRLVLQAAGGHISQGWIYPMQNPPSVTFMSATTPVPGGTCGRVVVSDLHLASGGMLGDFPTGTFPTGSCVTTDLEPREKVLEFMLFDIGSCVHVP